MGSLEGGPARHEPEGVPQSEEQLQEPPLSNENKGCVTL